MFISASDGIVDVAQSTEQKEKHMFTVMGATGNVGSVVVKQLLDAGEEVRAMGRSRDRLVPLEAAGAIPAVGDAADPDFLGRSFGGADAVHVMMPFDPVAQNYLAGQQHTGEAIAGALRAAGVPHVVALSSVGADMAEGNGVVATLHEQEERLRPLTDEGIHVLALRPALYFETFAEALDVARTQGIVAEAVDPDVPVPMISARDVGVAAARAMLARDWTGWETRELRGPRHLTYPEVTRILGAALGLPDLPYVRLPDADMIGVLREAGVAEPQATLLVGLSRGLSDGTVASREERSASNTMPTRFEDYAAELTSAPEYV